MTVTKEYLRDLLSEETVPYELNPEWEVVTNVAVVAAARFVERLLPEPCEHGESEPHASYLTFGVDHAAEYEAYQCSGQLWDEGLVEVVAAVICENDFAHDSHPSEFLDAARAVLSALAEEAGK